MNTVHECLFCPQTFDSAAKKDDHILDHFAHEECMDCHQKLIRIGANLYTIHNEATCVKGQCQPNLCKTEAAPDSEADTNINIEDEVKIESNIDEEQIKQEPIEPVEDVATIKKKRVRRRNVDFLHVPDDADSLGRGVRVKGVNVRAKIKARYKAQIADYRAADRQSVMRTQRAYAYRQRRAELASQGTLDLRMRIHLRLSEAGLPYAPDNAVLERLYCQCSDSNVIKLNKPTRYWLARLAVKRQVSAFQASARFNVPASELDHWGSRDYFFGYLPHDFEKARRELVASDNGLNTRPTNFNDGYGTIFHPRDDDDASVSTSGGRVEMNSHSIRSTATSTAISGQRRMINS